MSDTMEECLYQEVTRITIGSSSGYGCIEDAWEDRVVITNHSVHYEFKPETQVKLKPISWTAKANGFEHQQLFQELSKAVMTTICSSSLKDFYDDVGMIALSLAFTDKSKKTKHFYVLPEDLEPCFSIMKKIVKLAINAPEGMFAYE